MPSVYSNLNCCFQLSENYLIMNKIIGKLCVSGHRLEEQLNPGLFKCAFFSECERNTRLHVRAIFPSWRAFKFPWRTKVKYLNSWTLLSNKYRECHFEGQIITWMLQQKKKKQKRDCRTKITKMATNIF